MTSRLDLSAFIICKNEVQYIEPCIRSLDLCAEIIVVDSGSTDGTLALLQKLRRDFPIKIFERGWPGYAAQKQFALEQCTQPWCLNIDADERLDRRLREELPRLLAEDGVTGWRIRRRPFLVGFGYTPVYVFERPNLRLLRRGAGAYDLSQRVHEGISVKGRVKIARSGSLLHFRPLALDEQILKENAYSTLKADQLLDEGKTPRWSKLVFNPPYYFLRLYFGRRLFLCGWAGLIQAMTGAVYSFMTEAKIWQRHALAAHPSKEPPLGGV